MAAAIQTSRQPNIRITMKKLVEHQWCSRRGKSGQRCWYSHTVRTNSRMCKLLSALRRRTMKSTKWNTLESPLKPTSLNALDIIPRSKGFDLSGLFENDQEQKENSRFMTQKPASAIVSKVEQIVETECFKVKKQDGMVKLQGSKKGGRANLGSMLRSLR
jgi:5'-AMP-activated protein kinase, catalytic alpha subunit